MIMFRKLIMKLVKKKGAAILVGFLLLIVLIWYGGGRYLRLQPNTRLLAIVVLLFIGILYLQIKQMQARRGAAKLEHSIKEQADEQKLGMRPEKREEIENLKLELIKAIEALKQSKLGRGRSGRSALYALPWYMFIGPPAAGKTTAIINSGLEFPYQSEIKGVGGTRNCDWFFSKSAILLDTAGRYTTEEEDRAEWHAFLAMLKKHRSQRPINGVLVGVSITDFMDASFEDIEWHAKNIRHRIDELVERLGTRFPVYLVFTKCDLLQGFVELFENLSRKEREQIWGATLSQEQQSSDPSQIFNEEFQVLLKALSDFRMKRLSVPTKSEHRSKLYVFPLEFASIKERVGLFINQLFQPNPYQENPFFRGFYFTSGTQEGVPIDLVIQAVAKQFDLPPGIVSEPEVEKKSYFIKNLFTDVIIPDQNMVTPTSGIAARKNRIRLGTVAVSAVLLGLFVLWIFQGSVRSSFRLSKVNSAVRGVEDIEWDNFSSFEPHFSNLDLLRDRIEKMEAYGEHPPFFRSYMDRGSRVLPHARSLYYDNFNSFINEFLFNSLIWQKLSDYVGGAVYAPGKIGAYLTCYLLMSSQNQRLIDDKSEETGYRVFLETQLLGILDEAFLERIPESQYMQLRPLMQNQIRFFIGDLGRKGMPAFIDDTQLVDEVRLAIRNREIENSKTVYDGLKMNDGAKRLPDISLSLALGAQHSQIMSSDREVPGLFTRNGYEEYFKSEVYKYIQLISKDDWIMGKADADASGDKIDAEATIKSVKSLYFSDYEELWRDLMRGVRYHPYENLSEAADFLSDMGDRDESPLVALLTLVTLQTQYVSQAPETEASQKKAPEPLSGLIKKDKETSASDLVQLGGLTQAFSDIHALCAAPGENLPVEMISILQLYKEIGIILELMSENSGPKSKVYALEVIKESNELPKAIRTIRSTLSDFDEESRRALFEQPLINAWRVILANAQDELNSLWKTRVYNEFQSTLADKYPFYRQGGDATLQDIKDFFNSPGGVFESFISKELAPFVNLDDWSPKTWQKYGIQLSEAAVEAFRKASDLQKNLFQSEFPFSFNMKPIIEPDHYEIVRGSVPSILTIALTINGKNHKHEMGPSRAEEFFWPDTEGQGGASLQIIMSELDKALEPTPKKYNGVWGLFKLLDEAEIKSEGAQSSDFQVSWLFSMPNRSQVRVKYLLNAKSMANPFRNFKSLFRFQCPAKLNADLRNQ